MTAVDATCGVIRWHGPAASTEAAAATKPQGGGASARGPDAARDVSGPASPKNVEYNVMEVEGPVQPQVGDLVEFTFQQLPFAGRSQQAGSGWGLQAFADLRAVGVTVKPRPIVDAPTAAAAVAMVCFWCGCHDMGGVAAWCASGGPWLCV